MKHTSLMTQEQLANTIDRRKMTVSQFKNGKNTPLPSELLNKIISALYLNAKQDSYFCFISSESHKILPCEIESYFLKKHIYV